MRCRRPTCGIAQTYHLRGVNMISSGYDESPIVETLIRWLGNPDFSITAQPARKMRLTEVAYVLLFNLE